MKKVALLYTDESPLIDAIKYQLRDYIVDCLPSLENEEQYDLVVESEYKGIFNGEALKCHHSLLPAFGADEPIKDAMMAGVKITGVTFYFSKSKNIIAQYPVFITNEMHYDELKNQILYVEQMLFPYVIQKYLENEPIDLHRMMKSGCGKDCSGGCISCNH